MTMTKRQQIAEKADAIQANAEEMRRLAKVLEYYAWLEEWGLGWDMIKGVTAPLLLSPMAKQGIKSYARSVDKWNYDAKLIPQEPKELEFSGLGKTRYVAPKYDDELREFVAHPPRNARAISYELKDGRKIVLPFPPFPHNVVYNKDDKPETWVKDDSKAGVLRLNPQPEG